MEAERELGIKYANSSINACCRNKKNRTTAFGYKWKYHFNNFK